jgi:aspartate racemase
MHDGKAQTRPLGSRSVHPRRGHGKRASPKARRCQTRSKEDFFMEQKSVLAETKKIGLIGGLAFRAGVFYYDQIQQRYTAQHQKLSLVLGHADVGTVLACVGTGNKAGLGSYLGSLANELFDAGAELVAVTAVAPHLAMNEVSQAARGPIVNVLELINPGLKVAGVDRVAVLGNRAVMETDVFGPLPKQNVIRLAPAVMEAVHTTYNDIALHGKRGTEPEVAYLKSVAEQAVRDGAQAILLAGTDRSSFYAEQPPTYPFVDVARLHIDEIIRRAAA